MDIIIELLAKIGGGLADIGTKGCIFFIMDEPVMPKALIEK